MFISFFNIVLTLSHISFLKDSQDIELQNIIVFFQPATLRCAVLTAFVEIVMVVYKGNLPEGNFRRSRDRLLLHLQV